MRATSIRFEDVLRCDVWLKGGTKTTGATP
jgi:hypothetical protein